MLALGNMLCTKREQKVVRSQHTQMYTLKGTRGCNFHAHLCRYEEIKKDQFISRLRAIERPQKGNIKQLDIENVFDYVKDDTNLDPFESKSKIKKIKWYTLRQSPTICTSGKIRESNKTL